MNHLFKLLFIGLLAICQGRVVRKVDTGRCPDFSTKQDLEIEPYLGKWYEFERFATAFEGFTGCVQAIYSPKDDGSVKVHNTGWYPSGKISDIVGTAEVVGPGQLTVQFPGSPKGDYNVLETDYENFASIYSCTSIALVRVQYAWVLTRERQISDEVLNRAHKAFTDNGIDVNNFWRTYQGEKCEGLSPP